MYCFRKIDINSKISALLLWATVPNQDIFELVLYLASYAKSHLYNRSFVKRYAMKNDF